MRHLLSVALAACFGLGAGMSRADDKPVDEATAQLAIQATTVLKDRCWRCHGGAQGKIMGMDVIDRDNLVMNRKEEYGFDYYMVAPSNLDESQVWSAISGEAPSMPKSGSPEAKAMTAADRDLIQKWIEAGAPFPERRKSVQVSEEMVLTAILRDLQQADPDDRPYLRYFTIHHLHNNPKKSVLDMNIHRAALSKVINSLNWQNPTLILPRPLPGTEDTVFAIDISELDWDEHGRWDSILGQYPYGVHFQHCNDERLEKLAIDIYNFSKTDLPYVRMDWFIVYASQAPLYTELMELPLHVKQLEHRLNVDFESNFMRNKLARSGFVRSGVSQQNRLIERHDSREGYYWVSYDFLPRKPNADLIRYPLGPNFTNNEYRRFAFEHDGGEVIYSLPNGLQGYMLLKGDGSRLDAPGPIEVVFDSSAPLGNPNIHNGISCMICHKQGIISQFHDEIRNSNALAGPAMKKVRDLYPSDEDMQKLVKRDINRFMVALERVTGPYLQVGPDKDKSITDFPEPVGKVGEQYYKDLGPEELAYELGYKPEDLRAVIRTTPRLLQYGLGNLTHEPAGYLKREKWEARALTSLYHDVCVILKPGVTPVVRLQRTSQNGD